MSEANLTQTAKSIMFDFAERTGLSDRQRPAVRYLWTDAHAVVNFLSLHQRTGDPRFRELALELVEQVHSVLGRHREDDERSGWISGLGEEEGRKHPTAGGLRIGKARNERRVDEPFDERAEWDRDGQYFHYLTKWVHALCRVAVATSDIEYCRYANELVRAGLRAFSTGAGDRQRLAWKMSIDLSYPLVPSMGQHDPLDAYVTCSEVEHCAAHFGEETELASVADEVRAAASMLRDRQWQTDDPLGIGGLLFDACRLFQLVAAGRKVQPGVVSDLVHAAAESLTLYTGHFGLNQPARLRLPFREFGLSIGLHALTKMRNIAVLHADRFAGRTERDLEGLAEYVGLAGLIENFWLDDANRGGATWCDHADINAVMLATSLVPDEFLNASAGR